MNATMMRDDHKWDLLGLDCFEMRFKILNKRRPEGLLCSFDDSGHTGISKRDLSTIDKEYPVVVNIGS
jgi:hypothetical protein